MRQRTLPVVAVLALAALTGAASGQGVSTRSSNTTPYDTRSQIAPRLPTPAVGADTRPWRYLENARRALAAGHTGEAQEALERAETRLLNSTPTGGAPEMPGGLIHDVGDARRALGLHDTASALRILDGILARLPPETGAPAGGPEPPPAAWVPGQWVWDGFQYVWMPPHPIGPPPTAMPPAASPSGNKPAHWEWLGNGWVWVPAGWR